MSEVVFYRFQPDAMDKETLERLFTGKKRKELLKRLTKEIAIAVKNQTPRYYLIVGPRGVGKTHFVTLLYCDVEEQVANSLPIKFSEEEFSLYRVSHLLLRLLEMLGIDLSTFEQMSEDEVVVAALDELKSKGKMIVLFLENLNQILGEQMDKSEVQRLRSIFQTENIFTVVTTAPLMFPEVSEYEEPFFNFFEYIYLGELTRAELKELVKEIATIENDEAFLSKMDEYSQKLDAVYVLTGGSPRMALLLYDLMSKGNLEDVEIALFKLLDENTPYYQGIFRSLSAVTRRVFDTLIELGKPATPKEIAEKARLDNNTVNTLLRRLEKDGLVRSRKRGRSTKYEVREQLFRLWRELRRQPFAKQKLSIFINFLELWYTVEERKEKFLALFGGLREALDERREREASYWFLSLPKEYKKELMPQVVKEIYGLGKATLLDEWVYGDKELKAKAVETGLRILFEERKYEVILERTEEMIKADEYDFIAWIFKSAALVDLGRREEAVVALSKSIELMPEIAAIWDFKGSVLGNLERYEEALEAFSKSLELNPENPDVWVLKGRTLGELGRYEEALEAFTKAIELNPKDAGAWMLKGIVNFNITTKEFRRNNYGNALENLDCAIEALNRSADLLKDREKAEEIIKESLMAFFKERIETKNVKVIDMALNALFEKNEELKKLFEPIAIAVEIVKSKDINMYYELQVERREVVAEIVKKLTGSEELLPEEYRSR